jgi:hypothetical protein
MTFAAERRFGISQQRGFWLRCFLGFCCFAWIASPAPSQVAAPAPYHLSHLRGLFVDARGNPIPGAAVTLDQNDKVVDLTRTDRTGKFEIRHVSGRYWLHVDMKGYSTVSREVIVGLEALTYVRSSTLYVIAGPAACSDDCSSVFTSKSKFEHALHRNTEHHD